VITSITPKRENRKDFLQAQPAMSANCPVDIPANQSYVSMAGLATPPFKTTWSIYSHAV
jgi:hypothetical protein